jgi:hypothetical protein
MAKPSQRQKQRAFLLWVEEESRRREWPTVEICAARSPPIRRRQSSLSTPHRAVEAVAAASATSQIGCEMVVACEVIASRDGQGWPSPAGNSSPPRQPIQRMMGCCGKAWGKARAFWSYQQQHHQRQPSEFKAKQTDSEQLHPDSSLPPSLSPPSPLPLNK